MPYQAMVYKVMIASPRDVLGERSMVADVIKEWNIINAEPRKTVLLPVGWETHAYPTMGGRPQAIINQQVLKGCDLLVGVFWTRLGTPTGEYASGTVEEIEEHIKTGKPVMLYFSDVPVVLDSVDSEQYAELKKFKDVCKSRGIYQGYSDLNDFRDKFYRQLQLTLNDLIKHESITSTSEVVTSQAPEVPNLSREAQILLKEASQDPNGHIVRVLWLDGLNVKTNNKLMWVDKNPRDEAIWEAAIKELEDAGLIAARGVMREIFVVTRKGYELADLLNP